MSEVMGPLPESPQGLPEVAILEESKFPEFIRKKLTFHVGRRRSRAGVSVHSAKSEGAENRRHCVCTRLPRSVKRNRRDSGASRTYTTPPNWRSAALLRWPPIIPGYGDYKIDPYAMGYVSATMKGIRNHRRAVDLLVSMPEVDRRRVGVIGHSLGGHNSLFLAAFDPRVAAVVSELRIHLICEILRRQL